MTYDLAIVGGGPAGLAVAIYAAQRDLSSVVLERRRLPLDKACGEGLMPPGVDALAEMGVEIPAGGSEPFVGIRYVDGETVAEGKFANGHGLAVRRTALIEGLHRRADALGVALCYGQGMQRWEAGGEGQVTLHTREASYQARMMVGADGVNSALRKQLGLAKARGKKTQRFGIRRHYRLKPWSNLVEVHWSDGVEAYVTPSGSERVGVALLAVQKEGHFDELLARFPAVREKLGDADTVSEIRGAGPFNQKVRRRYAEGVPLVGDAAGYLDAITGEGMTLAFHTARALVDTIHAGASLDEYEKAYRSITATYYRLTTLLLWIAARPKLRHRFVTLLSRHPRIFERLLAINCNQAPLSSLVFGL